MYSTLAAALALATALTGPLASIVGSDPVSCHRGASTAPAPVTIDLERSAPDWGGYCERFSQWTMTDTADGLVLEYGGGEPYSNVHFYRNVSLPSGARSVVFSFDVLVPSTTYNNVGAPSTIQALEFTVSRWESGRRHEWAIQWVNVGASQPGYRIWNPELGWVDSGVTGILAPGWHRIELVGQVTSGGARLRSFSVDGSSSRINLTVPAVDAPGVADIGAVAVQLDGNFEGAPYAVTVRDVDLSTR